MNLSPGCFGSAIFYRVDAVECAACPLQASCGPRVFERSKQVIRMVGQFDQRFEKNIAQDCLKWFNGRMTANVTRKVSSARNQALLTYWTDHAVNVHHLEHGRNPIETPGTVTHSIFAFMLEAKVFKPGDIVEALQWQDNGHNKGELKKLVKNICDALLHGGHIRKEKYVLCLKS